MRKISINVLFTFVLCFALLIGCTNNDSTDTEISNENESEATELEVTEKSNSNGTTKEKLTLVLDEDIKLIMEDQLNSLDYDVEFIQVTGVEGAALAIRDGVADVAIMNNKQWVKTFNEENGTNILTLQPELFSPIRALWSIKYDSIDEIPDNSTIVIAADGTNQQRDLKTLAASGILEISDTPSIGRFISIHDITNNPKNLEIMTVDHPTAVNYLEDAAAVITDSRNMKDAGYDFKNYLFEDPNRVDFRHGIMVEEENQDAPWIKDIFAIWDSPEFKDAYFELYEGSIELLDISEYKNKY